MWPVTPVPVLIVLLCAVTACRGRLHAQEEQGIDAIAAREIGMTAASGLVAAIHYGGDLAFLQAYGSPDHDRVAALSPDAVFAFPAFIETLAAASAGVMAGRGAVDMDAPVGTYVPGLPAAVGEVTLRQLLSHTAGLDDAEPGDDAGSVRDGISERTAFTEPGMVYSRSRYSLPLVIQVLEEVGDAPFAELVSRGLLEPLGMERSTFDPAEAREMGLLQGYAVGTTVERRVEPVSIDPADPAAEPSFFTTAGDLARFAGAWMAGTIPDLDALPSPEEGVVYPRGERRYVQGISTGRFQELPDLLQSGSWGGFGGVVRLLPHQGLAVVALGNGNAPPHATAGFALRRIVDQLRAAQRAPDPPDRVAGSGEGAEVGESPQSPPAELAGSYVNGDRLHVLVAREDDLFYFDGTRELVVRRVEGPVFSVHLADGREVLRFQLARDREGRLYLFRNGRAYLRTEGVRPAGVDPPP